MTSRPSNAAPILAVLAIVAALLGAYVGGYFWLGRAVESFDYSGPTDQLPDMVRQFDSPSMRALYEPAARVESFVRGKKVAVWVVPQGGTP